MKKIYLLTYFFMSEDCLPEVETEVYDSETIARRRFDTMSESILADVEQNFSSHSTEPMEAEAVYSKEDDYCEGYADGRCTEWWRWVRLTEKWYTGVKEE